MPSDSIDGFTPWPSEFGQKYESAGVWANTTLAERLDASLRDHAERIAIVEANRSVTYRELDERSRRVALQLAARGITGGARVLLQLPNVIEFVVAYAACLRANAIPVACSPHHQKSEISALADHAGAKAWMLPGATSQFDFPAMAEELLALPSTIEHAFVLAPQSWRAPPGSRLEPFAELERDAATTASITPAKPTDPAVFQLSGGTTGIPKLIPRTHNDYLYNSLKFAEVSAFGPDSVLLVSIPIGHNFSLACPGIQGALLLGARVVLAPSPNPEIVFPLIERERVTWIPAVPAALIRWTEYANTAKHDLSSVRSIYVGGQRLNREPAMAARRVLGPVVKQCYGMAEGLLCCTRSDDPEEVHLSTQGRPMCELDELKIVDEADREVPHGEVGELLVRGAYTIRGYYRADEHNATAFDANGFYRTGDMVRLDAAGNVSVEGRRKDLINRGGEKIGVEDLENVLHAHPSIRDCAVVAAPDPVLGERVCACIVPAGDPLSLDDVVAYMKAHGVATYKLPERVETFDALPRTGVGKVSKQALRAEVARRVAAAPNAT